jgi:hypothetical protein
MRAARQHGGMECRQCATPLERPGDFCLTCREANADTVVVACDRDRASVTVLLEGSVVAERTVTTRPETDGERVGAELRNFAGRLADEVHRKRPEEVYAAGDRTVLEALREQLHYPLRRVEPRDGQSVVDAVRERAGERSLEVVETPPDEKLGGSHTTLVGGRDGMTAVRTVAAHPHVKKVIPGPISAGGSGSRSGLRAKATRADENGNVRLLVRDGSSVQENRVVTTAGSREMGERVRDDLEESLREAGLQE